MASQPQRKTKGGPDDIDKHVGARIRLRRIRLGMSQEALGKSLGLTFQQVQKYEKGANRVGAGRLFQLSEVLEVPIQFFYDDIGDMIGAATGFAEDEPTDPFMDLVNSPDGIQLCRYFSEIEDAKVRKRVLELVRSIAETESGKSG
ncbi:MAG: helix-turn-helix domain-containing protein [Pseudomonadota bacterium]